MFHQFQGFGIDILDVHVTKDGKLAKVLFTTPFHDRRESLMRRLEANAGRLKGYVGGMLKTKNTPRLMFVDAEKRKMEYAREEEAYKEIAEARRRGEGVEDEDADNDDNGDGAIPRERDDGLSTTVM
jgi:ribosome-binding factor A